MKRRFFLGMDGAGLVASRASQAAAKRKEAGLSFEQTGERLRTPLCGVNLWLHTALQPPPDVSRIPEGVLRSVQEALNRFRARLGLAPSLARPAPLPDVIGEAFELILEERVPVWSIGLGDPGKERVRRCRERGVKVMAMVSTVEDARAVADSGVGLIIAQGGEAGGHRSTWVKPASREVANIGTLALVPQIVDAVRVPVIAAGGIADGRGLVAALPLGAVGNLLGTRFVATRESMAPEFWKKSLLEASSDRTTVTDAFTGLLRPRAPQHLHRGVRGLGRAHSPGSGPSQRGAGHFHGGQQERSRVLSPHVRAERRSHRRPASGGRGGAHPRQRGAGGAGIARRASQLLRLC
jgi:hypothetical protein